MQFCECCVSLGSYRPILQTVCSHLGLTGSVQAGYDSGLVHPCPANLVTTAQKFLDNPFSCRALLRRCLLACMPRLFSEICAFWWPAWGFQGILRSGASFCLTGKTFDAFHPSGRCGTFCILLKRWRGSILEVVSKVIYCCGRSIW